MPGSTVESVPVTQRIATLDILRGFALLGILIMNMPGFSTSFFAEADGSHLWPGAVDQCAENVRDMLFSGKFNSMFSLLFGIGFTIQFARMEQRDAAGASALYLRRLAVLAVIGIVHATLFWTGDVLHIYAMLGLLLVFPLRRARPRMIVLLIVACLLYPAVSGTLRLLVTTPEITAMLVARAQALEAADNLAYGSGSFVDAAREHAPRVQVLLRQPLVAVGHARLLRADGAHHADRPARRPPPVGAAHPRADAADPAAARGWRSPSASPAVRRSR